MEGTISASESPDTEEGSNIDTKEIFDTEFVGVKRVRDGDESELLGKRFRCDDDEIPDDDKYLSVSIGVTEDEDQSNNSEKQTRTSSVSGGSFNQDFTSCDNGMPVLDPTNIFGLKIPINSMGNMQPLLPQQSSLANQAIGYQGGQALPWQAQPTPFPFQTAIHSQVQGSRPQLQPYGMVPSDQLYTTDDTSGDSRKKPEDANGRMQQDQVSLNFQQAAEEIGDSTSTFDTTLQVNQAQHQYSQPTQPIMQNAQPIPASATTFRPVYPDPILSQAASGADNVAFSARNWLLLQQFPQVAGSVIPPFPAAGSVNMQSAAVLPPHQPTLAPRPLGISLALSCDEEQLSEYQTLLRKQLTIFEATQEDVELTIQGRKKRVVLGQVGIRCLHCAGFPLRVRGRGAVYYPARLQGRFGDTGRIIMRTQ